MMIISFIILLALLVLVHELGHFAVAKASGVNVEEFGLGFPPRLVSVQWRGTRYSLNLLLLGGFVRLAGEEDPQAPGSLASKSIGTRLLVLSAGSIMNLLLPIVLFSGSLMLSHQVTVGKVQIQEIAPNSPAQRAELQPGDIIVEMNHRPIQNLGDLHYNIQLRLGRETTMLVQSGSQQKMVSLTPRWRPPSGEGALGVNIELVNPVVVTQSYPFWEAIPLGVRSIWETLSLFRNAIMVWFIGGETPQVVGPVGIAQMTGEVAKSGISPLMNFAAFLSINLAIINLLPLPALDGGRLVFVLLEWVRRGKRVPPQKEKLVHLIGLAMLIALIAIISYYDIARLLAGEGLP